MHVPPCFGKVAGREAPVTMHVPGRCFSLSAGRGHLTFTMKEIQLFLGVDQPTLLRMLGPAGVRRRVRYVQAGQRPVYFPLDEGQARSLIACFHARRGRRLAREVERLLRADEERDPR